MNRLPGDWNCRSCQHLNFSRRESCQRCCELRSSDNTILVGIRGGSSFGSIGADVRPGDWYCQCGTHNFASRSSCFKLNALKDDQSAVVGGGYDADMLHSRGFGFGGGGGRGGWKSGDWICYRSGCNEHNFAGRMECYRCNGPRNYSTGV